MDCPAASLVYHISGIIHRCFCRFWRSPIALKLIIILCWLATVSHAFLWNDQVVGAVAGSIFNRRGHSIIEIFEH
jgi:hypothetical protein